MANSYVCIGYVPLFYVDPERDCLPDDSEEELSDFIHDRFTNIPAIDVRVCLFANYYERMTPIFVINKARDFIDHLLAYSEGRPEEYFKLLADQYEEGYFLILQPRLDRAILKCRRQQQNQGRDIAEDAVIHILAKYVAFSSRRLEAFGKLDRSKGLHVGFVDERDVDLSEAQVTPEPTFIGPLEVEDGTQMSIRHLFR